MASPRVLGCWCRWQGQLWLPADIWATYLSQQQIILHLQIRRNFYKCLIFPRSSCSLLSPLCNLISLFWLSGGRCDPSALLQRRVRASSTWGTQASWRRSYHCRAPFSLHFIPTHSLSIFLPTCLSLELVSCYPGDQHFLNTFKNPGEM